MTTLVLLHSALGRNAGIDTLAGKFTAAGHTVHTPDFYEGRTFTTAEAGVGPAVEIGFSRLVDRVAAACEGLPGELVLAGLSLGAGNAQQMGKNDARARGALLLHGGGLPKPTRWHPRFRCRSTSPSMTSGAITGTQRSSNRPRGRVLGPNTSSTPARPTCSATRPPRTRSRSTPNCSSTER